MRPKCSRISVNKKCKPSIRALLEPWMPEAYLEPCLTSMMEICYLKRSKSRNPSKKQCTLVNYIVYPSSDEIFEPFVEPNGDLSMENDAYSKCINSTD